MLTDEFISEKTEGETKVTYLARIAFPLLRHEAQTFAFLTVPFMTIRFLTRLGANDLFVIEEIDNGTK